MSEDEAARQLREAIAEQERIDRERREQLVAAQRLERDRRQNELDRARGRPNVLRGRPARSRTGLPCR